MAWVPLKKIAAQAIAAGLMWTAPNWLCAQSSDGQSSDQDQSWSATSESRPAESAQSVRTSETHKKSGNRTVDKRSIEGVGPEGQYQTVKDVETESVKVNATTTRTITRTFGRSLNGERTLTQVQEAETRELPNGATKTTVTTSHPEFDGRLQVQEREERETKNLSPTTRETRATISVADTGGGLSPVIRTVERQIKTGESTSKFTKSKESRNLNGGWQMMETREGTIEESGAQRTTDETVSKADVNGNLSVASRTVTSDALDSHGDTRSTVETYSKETLGSAPDRDLHLSQRVTTVVKNKANGSTREMQVEDRSIANPSDGIRASSKTIDIVRTGPTGTSEKRTTHMERGNGSLDAIEVDTRKSDQTPIKVEIAPDKPK